MKATLGLIALVATPAAAGAAVWPYVTEPAFMVLSGAMLLGLASAVRRYAP